MTINRIIRSFAVVALLVVSPSAAPPAIADDTAEDGNARQTTTEGSASAEDTPDEDGESGGDEAGDEDAASTESAEVQSAGDDTAGEEPEPEFDDIPWELRPFRVLVSVAFSDPGAMNVHFVSSTIDRLSRLTDGAVGPYWQPTYEVNDWMFPQTAQRMDSLTGEALSQRYQSGNYDKALHLVLETDGPWYRLTGSEWDVATQSRGPTRTRRIVDRRRVPQMLFEMMWALFRPLTEIEFAEGTFAELRVRGGELLSPESPKFPFRTGDLLTPYFRYLDRDRKLRQIQTVPWTYLRVDDITRSRMTATIETAYSNPLGGSRRRVELVGVRIEPVYSETELALTPRTNPNQPLVGVRVRVFDRLPTEEDPRPERIDLMTDRDGVVTVPTAPDVPLRRLIVHSGGAVLSNVPFVPGVDSRLSMQLPDDSPRLQVEGNLAMVQGDLIDQVSRRAVMLARALSLAKKEQFDESDKLMEQVDAQTTIGRYESRILAIRVPAVEQARANRDRSQEKRIRMMCQDLEDLVRKYLDRDKVDAVKEEISELKKIAG